MSTLTATQGFPIERCPMPPEAVAHFLRAELLVNHDTGMRVTHSMEPLRRELAHQGGSEQPAAEAVTEMTSDVFLQITRDRTPPVADALEHRSLRQVPASLLTNRCHPNEPIGEGKQPPSPQTRTRRVGRNMGLRFSVDLPSRTSNLRGRHTIENGPPLRLPREYPMLFCKSPGLFYGLV